VYIISPQLDYCSFGETIRLDFALSGSQFLGAFTQPDPVAGFAIQGKNNVDRWVNAINMAKIKG
jgi:hypothetical protein